MAQAKQIEDVILVDGARVLDLYQKRLEERTCAELPPLARVPTQTVMVRVGLLIAACWLGGAVAGVYRLITR